MQPTKRTSRSDPSPMTSAGIFTALFRGRRVSAEPDVTEKLKELTVGGENLVVSPRFSRTYGRAKTVHLDVIISLLDSTQAGAPFVAELYKKFSTLILTDQKPLKNAACDLWRSMPKVKIFDCDKLVLDVHRDAFNDLVPEDAADTNRRFLQILRWFSKVQLPDSVDWKKIDDVAKWIDQSLPLDVQHPLARFIRSWSQDRYNGLLTNEVLTGFGFTPDSEPAPPIIAKLRKEKRTHSCIFFADGTHTEELLLPIEIVDRETRRPTEDWIHWTLEFRYDASCILQEVTSRALPYREEAGKK